MRMNPDEKLLYDLKQLVLDNLNNEQFSVEQLSQMVGMSRSHLHRRLKKLKGQSISQFIREIRLEEALVLLQEGAETSSEIAYQVGFNSPSYFHKCFLDHYGFPPSETKLHAQNHPDSNEPNKKTANVSRKEKRKKKGAINYSLVILSIVVLLISGYVAYYYSKIDAVSTSVEKSIAVLPFRSLSEDQSNQHFADGLVEDLLNRLAVIDEFKVISRTSSDAYYERGKKKVPEIAAELGVSYIVEGSVQKHENKVRITIQLIDAINDDHIWIKSFDRDLEDIFEIQSEVALQVVSGLETVLTEQQTIDVQKNQTENVKAFELYQLGRLHWEKRSPEGFENSIIYFQQAIQEDSNYALAYAGLADTYFLLSAGTKRNSVNVDRERAIELAGKALDLDPRLAEAYTVLASVYFSRDWNWDAAEKEFKKALELNSNYPNLHHRYSEFLSWTGRHEQARKHINKALELDPLSFVVRRVSANLYFNQGQFKETIAEAQIVEEINNGSVYKPWYNFVISYESGDGVSMAEWLKQLKLVTGDTIAMKKVDSVFEASGPDGLLRWEIEDSDWHLAKADYFGLLGEYDKAFDWLEVALAGGSYMWSVPYWYSLKDVQSNPRYVAILNEMNLPWSP